jgi:hypothetical protein
VSASSWWSPGWSSFTKQQHCWQWSNDINFCEGKKISLPSNLNLGFGFDHPSTTNSTSCVLFSQLKNVFPLTRTRLWWSCNFAKTCQETLLFCLSMSLCLFNNGI